LLSNTGQLMRKEAVAAEQHSGEPAVTPSWAEGGALSSRLHPCWQLQCVLHCWAAAMRAALLLAYGHMWCFVLMLLVNYQQHVATGERLTQRCESKLQKCPFICLV